MLESAAQADAVVTGEFLAAKLGISYSLVCRLAKQGVIPRAGRGDYPLWACILAYCERLREQAAGRAAGDDEGGPPDLIRERALLARAQREGQDMKNAVLRGDLLPVDDVEAVFGAVLDATRAKLLALPTKLAPRWAEATGLNAARDALTDGIHEALEELSSTPVLVVVAADRARRRSGLRAADDAPGTEDEAAAAADGEPVGGPVPAT